MDTQKQENEQSIYAKISIFMKNYEQSLFLEQVTYYIIGRKIFASQNLTVQANISQKN